MVGDLARPDPTVLTHLAPVTEHYGAAAVSGEGTAEIEVKVNVKGTAGFSDVGSGIERSREVVEPGHPQLGSSSRGIRGVGPFPPYRGRRKPGSFHSFSTIPWIAPRPCAICKRMYSNNSNLRRHLKAAHGENQLMQLDFFS